MLPFGGVLSKPLKCTEDWVKGRYRSLSLPFRRSRNWFTSTVNASRPRSGSAVRYTATGRKRQAGVPSDLLFRRTLCDNKSANEDAQLGESPMPTAALPA